MIHVEAKSARVGLSKCSDIAGSGPHAFPIGIISEKNQYDV